MIDLSSPGDEISPEKDDLACIMVRVENELVPWLNIILEDLGWSQRELARRAGIAHSGVSHVLSYQRKPTWDFCAAVAGEVACG